MSSFLSKAAAVAKSTAKAVADKTKETYEHLKAVPEKVTCTQCGKDVMVPYSTFNWICGSCSKVNEHKDDTCASSTCNASKPKDRPDFVVSCTMCSAVVKVPTTNFEKGARNAASATKKAATTAAVWSKEKYEHLKSPPARFSCEHCSTELLNPNGTAEEQKQREETAAAEKAAGHEPSAPVVEIIVCPVCSKTTKIPGSNFSNSATKTMSGIHKGASKLYYDVAGIRHAKCPVCSTPAKAPADVQKQAKEAKDGAPAQPVRVELECPKCSTKFPAVV